jgi:glycosyltransferase involved in cell wall biosynthesis
VLGSTYSEAVVELVKDGINGWLFDPLDRQTFFDAMEKFAKTHLNKNAYSKVRSEAIKAAEAASADRFASSFVDAIKFCLSSDNGTL